MTDDQSSIQDRDTSMSEVPDVVFAAIVRTSPGMTLKSMFVRSMLLAVLFARVKAYFWIPPETPVAEVS